MTALGVALRKTRERHRAIRADEAGFSLVELLVVILILPILVGAIASVLIATLDTTGPTGDASISGRVGDSSAVNSLAAFYTRDVQSATSVTTSSAATSPPLCGSGGTFEFALSWPDTAGTVVVSYWLAPTTGVMTRALCRSGAPVPSTAPDVVTSGLDTAQGIAVSVSPSAASTAASSGWVSAETVQSMAIAGMTTASSYRFELSATPRISISGGSQGGGNPAPPPLLLLGSSVPALNCSGNGSLAVHGAMYLDNSSAAGDASATGNSTVTATQIYSSYNPLSQSLTGSGTFSPSTVSSGSQIPDPYAGLTPPSATGLPVHSGGTYQGPGVYTTQLSISGGTTVLATGTYILQAGISISGQANVSSASGGVLLYVTGGQVSITGKGTVTISPLTPAPYPTAPNLGIWQAASDATPLQLAGNGSANTFGGTIYASSASVGVSGSGSGNLTVGGVISASLACSGNGQVRIG